MIIRLSKKELNALYNAPLEASPFKFYYSKGPNGIDFELIQEDQAILFLLMFGGTLIEQNQLTVEYIGSLL